MADSTVHNWKNMTGMFHLALTPDTINPPDHIFLTFQLEYIHLDRFLLQQQLQLKTNERPQCFWFDI